MRNTYSEFYPHFGVMLFYKFNPFRIEPRHSYYSIDSTDPPVLPGVIEKLDPFRILNFILIGIYKMTPIGVKPLNNHG
jgi:hypothetical protein